MDIIIGFLWILLDYIIIQGILIQVQIVGEAVY